MHYPPTCRMLLAITAGIILSAQTELSAAAKVLQSITSEANRQQLTAEGEELPELSAITFLCRYTLPHTTLFASLVATPLPSTALSVLVDTTSSTFTITLSATKPITLSSKTALFVIKAPSLEGTLTIVNATATHGTSSIDIPVTTVATSKRMFFRPAAQPLTAATSGRLGYTLSGRRTAISSPRAASGCLIVPTQKQTTLHLLMQ